MSSLVSCVLTFANKINFFLSDNSKTGLRVILRKRNADTMFPGYQVGDPVTVTEDVAMKMLLDCKRVGSVPVVEQIESIQFSSGVITERTSNKAYNTNYTETTLDAMFDSNSGLSIITFDRAVFPANDLPSSSKSISSHIVFTRAVAEFGKVQLIFTGAGDEDSLKWLVSCEAIKGCRYTDLSKALNIMFRNESEQIHPS